MLMILIHCMSVIRRDGPYLNSAWWPLQDYPDWSFDGSSTGQAEGNNSDRILE